MLVVSVHHHGSDCYHNGMLSSSRITSLVPCTLLAATTIVTSHLTVVKDLHIVLSILVASFPVVIHPLPIVISLRATQPVRLIDTRSVDGRHLPLPLLCLISKLEDVAQRKRETSHIDFIFPFLRAPVLLDLLEA